LSEFRSASEPVRDATRATLIAFETKRASSNRCTRICLSVAPMIDQMVAAIAASKTTVPIVAHG